MTTPNDDQRDASGKFTRGNRAAARGTRPSDRAPLTEDELAWRTDVEERLLAAGRGSPKWCSYRAGQALIARRFVESFEGLRGSALRAAYQDLRAASELLLRIEEEATSRSAPRDPLA